MHRYTVELRIVGQELNPDEVTTNLEIKPTQVRRRGEARSERLVWAENMWAFDARPTGQSDWLSLEEGLSALIEKFDPIRGRLKSYSSTNRVFIWCGHFASSFDGGPTLSPSLLTSLARFGVELVLDNYFEATK